MDLLRCAVDLLCLCFYCFSSDMSHVQDVAEVNDIDRNTPHAWVQEHPTLITTLRKYEVLISLLKHLSVSGVATVRGYHMLIAARTSWLSI